jgi:hypothetical protein
MLHDKRLMGAAGKFNIGIALFLNAVKKEKTDHQYCHWYQ